MKDRMLMMKVKFGINRDLALASTWPMVAHIKLLNATYVLTMFMIARTVMTVHS